MNVNHMVMKDNHSQRLDSDAWLSEALEVLRSLPGHLTKAQNEPVIAHGQSADSGSVDRMRAVHEFLAREDSDCYDNAM
jgi:hypothetical protein